MKYIQNLASKILISAKRIKNKIKEIIRDYLAAVGVLVMIADAALSIFSSNAIFVFYRNNAVWILLLILVVSIVKNRDRLSVSVKITDSPDVSITLKIGDALKNDGALIIPTNTTFDTKMDDEFISEGSIQGQYQIRFFKNRLSDLDAKIELGLKDKKYVLLHDGRFTKTKRYPIGTVCRISEKDKRVYFLADSDINKKGIPVDVDASDISQALVNLWDFLSKEGNQEPYSIPLIGTGKARAKNVSRDEAVQEIILSFLAATKNSKITENLTICIHPNDYEKVNWEGLCEFLKYECMYANLKPSANKQKGTEEILSPIVSLSEDTVEDDDIFDDEASGYRNRAELTEKEQMLITFLEGNEMKKTDVAETMGLSLNATEKMLDVLIRAGMVQTKGSNRNRIYYTSKK